MIAVIGATHAELRGVLARMQGTKAVTQTLPILYEGLLAGSRTTVILSGIGKVNAAAAADYFFARFSADAIISIGVAGALDPILQKGDIVLGTGVLCPEAANSTDVCSNPELVHMAERSCRELSRPCHLGKLVTVPSMVTSSSEKAELRKAFTALAVDMETFHVAQAASRHNVPFLSIRTISDPAVQSVPVDFSRLKRGSVTKWIYFLTHPGAFAAVRRFGRDIEAVSDRSAPVLETVVASMAKVPHRNAG